MTPVAEILTDHPKMTVIDQVDRLFLQKTITHADYRALLTTIAEARDQLNDPLTAGLAIELADGRAIRVSKYVAAAEEGRVRVEKRHFDTPSTEIEARVALLQK